MSYTTVAAVKGELSEFPSDQWGTGALPSEPKLTALIVRTDAEIDDECRALYEVPFDPVPPTIARLSLDLTVLAVLKGVRRQSGLELSEVEQDDHKQLTDKLRRIGAGKLHLDPEQAPQADTTAGGYTRPLSHLDDDATAGEAAFEKGKQW